jgi:hypothetical protein
LRMAEVQHLRGDGEKQHENAAQFH